MEVCYSEIANYRNLSPERLILTLNEIDEKISTLNKCLYSDKMLDMLYDYRNSIECLIEEYIAIGKINDSTYFEVDEYLRKKYELINYQEECCESVNNRFLTREISESQMIEELDKVKENFERELNALDKSLK